MVEAILKFWMELTGASDYETPFDVIPRTTAKKNSMAKDFEIKFKEYNLLLSLSTNLGTRLNELS